MTITVNTLSSVATSHDPLQNGDLFAVERAGTMGKTTWAEVQTQDFAASGDWTFTGAVDTTGATSMAGIYERDSATNLPAASSYTVTGIPSWANKIIITLGLVSGTATASLNLRLGTSGGIVSTGYRSENLTVTDADGLTQTSSTAQFQIAVGLVDTRDLTGTVTLLRYGGDIWLITSQAADNGGSQYFATGRINLGAALDRVQLFPGTGDFDTGGMNLEYWA